MDKNTACAATHSRAQGGGLRRGYCRLIMSQSRGRTQVGDMQGQRCHHRTRCAAWMTFTGWPHLVPSLKAMATLALPHFKGLPLRAREPQGGRPGEALAVPSWGEGVWGGLAGRSRDRMGLLGAGRLAPRDRAADFLKQLSCRFHSVSLGSGGGGGLQEQKGRGRGCSVSGDPAGPCL